MLIHKFLLGFTLLALVGAAAMAQGQSRSIVIDDFAAEINVLPDGTTEITETLRIDFRGSWQGLIRDLSLRHETAEGRRERLDIEVMDVTDEAGNSLRYETSRRGNTQEIQFWVPNAHDAVRTARIQYRLMNVLRFFGDPDASPDDAWDELYWNVTGNDWEMPIRNARARIILPDGTERIEAWGYTGRAGSNEQDASVEIAGNVIDVTANRSFGSREGLTVSVTWAPGLVDRTLNPLGVIDHIRSWWPLSLPILAFGFMFPRWFRHGREPRRGPITVRYEPPEGMSPAELGTLVDHKAEMHDITATLVDLAVRGYVLIEEVKKKALFGLIKRTEYHFHLLRPRSEWTNLEEHERLYLQGMFSRSTRTRTIRQNTADSSHLGDVTPLETVKLSDLSNRFYTHLEKIRTAIYDSLMARGYYDRRPDKRNVWLFISVYVFFGGFLFLLLGTETATSAVVIAAGFGSAFVILIAFSKAMRARTASGVRALEEALGFKEFLERVESDRYKRMITSPDLFERYLPHAMAFRVESRWAAAFEDLYTTPPNWYVGSDAGAFRTSSFTRNLNQMSTRASSTMGSSPSSSGSGGGGSSGGGSGGGGGRGF